MLQTKVFPDCLQDTVERDDQIHAHSLNFRSILGKLHWRDWHLHWQICRMCFGTWSYHCGCHTPVECALSIGLGTCNMNGKKVPFRVRGHWHESWRCSSSFLSVIKSWMNSCDGPKSSHFRNLDNPFADFFTGDSINCLVIGNGKFPKNLQLVIHNFFSKVQMFNNSWNIFGKKTKMHCLFFFVFFLASSFWFVKKIRDKNYRNNCRLSHPLRRRRILELATSDFCDDEMGVIPKIFRDIIPFCGATGTPVCGIWWCLCTGPSLPWLVAASDRFLIRVFHDKIKFYILRQNLHQTCFNDFSNVKWCMKQTSS